MSSVSPPSRSPSTGTSRTGLGHSNVPYGIYVIVVLGLLGALIGVLDGLSLLRRGYLLLGLVGLALAVGEAIVLVGLFRLRSWAWTFAMLLYGVGAFFELLTGELLGVVINIVLVLYLATVADVFE